MPIVDFSDRDILRSKIVKPAWYRVRVDNVAEGPSKNGDSTNWVIEGTILYEAGTKSEEFTGVPTPYWNFNSKAKGFMVGFFAALGVTIEAGKRYDIANSVGRELDVFIENDIYNGAPTNRINHKYRAPITD